jgi:hypothetical protein
MSPPKEHERIRVPTPSENRAVNRTQGKKDEPRLRHIRNDDSILHKRISDTKPDKVKFVPV